VAVLDVPPQVLLRNVTYGSSVGDGKSRGATGGLNSSEAWFIYLTFQYRDCGALLHFVLTAKFVKFVYIIYFFSRVFSEDVRHELHRNEEKRTDLSETRQDRRRNEVIKPKQDQSEQTYSKLCEIEAKLTKFPHPYGLHKHLRPFIFIINHQNI
jgi:hypothetical protein